MSVENDAIAAETRISQIFAQIGDSAAPPQVSYNPGAPDFQQIVQQQLNASLTSGNSPYNDQPSGDATAPPANLDAMIEAAGQKYGVSPNLIRAIAKNESGFNPNAVSPAGAKGIMQLMDGTAAGLGVTNPFDAAQNIDAGAHYLHNAELHYGNDPSVLPKVIASYNAGEGSVDRYNGVPPYAETQQYVQNVMASLDGYNAQQVYAKRPSSTQ